MKIIGSTGHVKWAMANFVVLTSLGVLLRYIQLYGLPGINYQFILHAHSHFAFAGWMFFAIALLINHTITGGRLTTAYRHVLQLTLISAYGMLVSFSLEGYKTVSIIFSSLFVFTTYYFTYQALKGSALKTAAGPIGYKLIKGALVFLCLSSLGPFTLGPLAAFGLKNTACYQDAIYFYLHFQMNGFMFLAALGLFALTSLSGAASRKSTTWLNNFVFSTIPLYFIFTLWNKPCTWINIAAAAGAVLNLVSWLLLCVNFKEEWRKFSFLAKAALIAATFKIVFQALVCIPSIGAWVFISRNLIIGYIHLLTLGVIMPLIIDQFIDRGFFKTSIVLTTVNRAYVVAVIFYLALLFIQPLLSIYSIAISQYQFLLFSLCVLFLPVGIVLMVKTKTYQ